MAGLRRGPALFYAMATGFDSGRFSGVRYRSGLYLFRMAVHESATARPYPESPRNSIAKAQPCAAEGETHASRAAERAGRRGPHMDRDAGGCRLREPPKHYPSNANARPGNSPGTSGLRTTGRGVPLFTGSGRSNGKPRAGCGREANGSGLRHNGRYHRLRHPA